MNLPQIHGFLSVSVTLYILFVTLWLLWKHLRDQPLDGNFWGVIWTGEILFGVQTLLGIILLITVGFPSQWVHLLYGFLTPLIWPATAGYLREQPDDIVTVPLIGKARRHVLIWFVVSAFLFGITLRARFTGLP